MPEIPLIPGLIIFSCRRKEDANGSAKFLISGAINWLQTRKLTNDDMKPTHTSVTQVVNGELMIFDSDLKKGVSGLPYHKWKKGRSYLYIYNPNLFLTEQDLAEFNHRIWVSSGDRYGLDDIPAFIEFLLSRKKNFKGKKGNGAEISPICSVLTAWLLGYKDWWQRTPLELFDNRKKDAPYGWDIYAGRP